MAAGAEGLQQRRRSGDEDFELTSPPAKETMT